MQSLDTTNRAFKAAMLLMEETRFNVFLTGKAGTGKTTFLRYLREHLRKKVAIVAPTGVAAVNAGGMTIHSLFHIPPSVYPPNDPRLRERAAMGQGISLRTHFKMSRARKKLFRELEVLVIDEISMVRCDLLDVIDRLLRMYGGVRHLPFGGKQLLFIGDPFQLPPVTPHEEWEILAPHYQSPYFFSALAWRDAQPKMLELRKVYRQQDQDFIDVLNRVRSGEHQEQDLKLLNQRFEPLGFDYAKQGYIYLGTTNRDVDRKNKVELRQLEGELFSYRADVRGDFKPADMPTLEVLKLKIGAQVMFVKNDTGDSRRYFNGKIGRITKLTEEIITVDCTKKGEPQESMITVERALWRKIRYEWNRAQQCIDEIETGRFEQFPLKLAWAITVHKSQGLTFEQVYANLNGAFAAGQTYVALSRCTHLGGLRLATKLRFRDIKVDENVQYFTQELATDVEIERLLDSATFLGKTELFAEAIAVGDFASAVEYLWELRQEYPDHLQELKQLKNRLVSALERYDFTVSNEEEEE